MLLRVNSCSPPQTFAFYRQWVLFLAYIAAILIEAVQNMREAAAIIEETLANFKLTAANWEETVANCKLTAANCKLTAAPAKPIINKTIS